VDRLLIANRGEIAIRIARTSREMGIAPLGVYSDADASAYHLEFMDEAARIGPASASESYLNIERVIATAKSLRADAVHPGYGFLSERAPFAAAVRDAGLTFVGPSPEAIAAMGDKAEAKRRARAHDVPVVPGYDGDDQAPARLLKEAKNIGTPVLIKAAAGGGGRGMRVVVDLAQFDAALEAARREALAAFGDDRVLLERYVSRPRHIEFQILADAHGTTLHFGERECSIQRRHQKIIEEAPSTALSPELRAKMGAAAIRAAQSVGYVNAGTVEFLLDESGAFYFLEMNARLQVEHPVTELVYDVDLVRLQLEIAAGKRLELTQNEIAPRGWAIEARINAEDPANDFLPASGTISHWEPPTGPGLRLDAGVHAGSDVSIYYDSMLAKLIAFGSDREAAAARLAEGLRSFGIDGVQTNIGLLARIAAEPDFRAGKTTTAYLGDHPELARPPVITDEIVVRAIAALLHDGRAWRIGGVGIPFALRVGNRTLRVTASRAGETERWLLSGDVAGEYRLATEPGQARVDARGVTVLQDGDAIRFSLLPPPSLELAGAAASTAGAGAVTSPMPGKIVKVAVKPGDTIAEHDLLVVLEAMKMEHRIEAPRAGVVQSVAATAGALVSAGATLVEIA
jgi:3-methylcrotonyl-CoA carboxylase alpha subunit